MSDNLEVIVHMNIRPGQLEGFKMQVAEILRTVRTKNEHTLRSDWFINPEGTQCVVHEVFPDEQGLIESGMNLMELKSTLFSDYASDHKSTICGEVSEQFVAFLTERMGPPSVFTFFQGIETPTSV